MPEKRSILLITSVLCFSLLFCSQSPQITDDDQVFSLRVSSDSTGSVVDSGLHRVSQAGEYELIVGASHPGFEFSHWAVISGEENITLLNKDSTRARVTDIQGDAHIKAIFAKSQHRVKIYASPEYAQKSVSFDPEPAISGGYDFGTKVKIKIVPASGWKIGLWRKNIRIGTDSATVKIEGDIIDTVLLTPVKVPDNVICVDQNATQNGGGEIGSNWVDAYTDLRDALAAVSQNKNIIWVARGKYHPTAKNRPFSIPANTTLIGGFRGIESDALERDSLRDSTILSGIIGTDTALTIIDVPQTSENIKISSFIIEDSKGVMDGNLDHGGLCARKSKNLSVQFCIFRRNYPRALEPGKNSLIEQCVFVENTGTYGAALTINQGDSILVRNCIFYKNISKYTGPAVYVGTHGCALIKCTIVNNHTNNESGSGSGGISNGGGLFMAYCILWGNTVDGTPYGSQIDETDTVYLCDIQGSETGDGIGEKHAGYMLSTNRDIDPEFVNTNVPVNKDYEYFTTMSGLRLQSTSTCTDVGIGIYCHNSWMSDCDISGNISPFNLYDIGAYDQ